MMTPSWYVQGSFSVFSEIEEADEFNDLISSSMEIESLEELKETIESSYEFLSSLVGMMDGDISVAITAFMDYEIASKEFQLFDEFQKNHKLGIPSSQDNYSSIVEAHINALTQYKSQDSKRIINALNLLKSKDLYTCFERVEFEDAQPLDFSITVMDRAYAAIINFMQEGKLDELNQVGEPLCESIPFNDRVIDRLNLLTNTYKELTVISNEGNV